MGLLAAASFCRRPRAIDHGRFCQRSSSVREPVSFRKSGAQGKIADVLHGQSPHAESQNETRRSGFSPSCWRRDGTSDGDALGLGSRSQRRMVVIITVILVPMATYLYQRSIIRAKEYVLKNNLSILRIVIHQYTHDKGKAPQTLHNLQEEGYLRDIPIDPMTASNTTWRITMAHSEHAVNQSELSIFDVASGSSKRALDGTNYSDW
jgi:general secretion pathway protein G